MKKVIFTAVSALAFASFADGVASTEFGALKVPSTMKTTIVGVPWLESGTGTTDVSVSNLVLTAGLANGSKLYLYDPVKGEYSDFWRLTDGVWEGTSDKVSIKRGSALKLERAGSDFSNGFYIMGKPTTGSGSVTMTLSKTEGTKAYTLVALPFETDKSPNEVTWTGIDSKDSLMVVLPDGSPLTLGWAGKTGSKKWKKWNPATYSWEDAPAIKAGMGAWFITPATSGTKGFSW